MGNQQVRQAKLDLLQVPDMEHYFVDFDGNIYSTHKQKIPKKLSAYKHYGKSKNPYMRVKMGSKLYLVHRIVVSVMLGRQLTKDEYVNHINGDTTDNRQSNLEVVTHSENVHHAVANKLYCSGEEWYKARGITKSL